MKKLLCAAFAAGLTMASFFCVNSLAASADTDKADVKVNCKSAYLCEYNSGECVYKLNECKRLPIASVCKVMTLNLCFDAIEEGKIKFDDVVTVSQRASGMGGSQVFLQNGLKYKVSELIKSIVVCSANDSCVAISETICGNEEAFVAKMNEKASNLGCADTNFVNCTGLPKEGQYSCAKDVAAMFSSLIKHEDYFKFSKIWLEDFAHPDNRTTSMTNTNKLLRRYNACDGGKTGFTNEAGFCLASTAQKDNLRFVSVILGSSASDERFDSAISLFDYGFANYKNKIVLDSKVNLNDKFEVNGSKKVNISVHPARSGYVFSAMNETPSIDRSVTAYELKAPVKKGDLVGKIEIFKDGVICDTVDLLAAEDAEKANYFDYLKIVAGEWTI